jgi:hypothetical protein
MDLIQGLDQYHIVIYKKCRVGVLPSSQWDSHFKRHKVAFRLRQKMKESVLKDPNIIHNESELDERFRYPVKGSAIEQLPVYNDGLACNMVQGDGETCQYTYRSQTQMKDHYRHEHGWINGQGRGGSMKQRQSVERPWRKNVYCQRLFHSGPKCGYWEVQAPASGARDVEGRTHNESPGVNEMFETIRTKQEERENQLQVVSPGEKLDANPWLERVEWVRHLDGFHMDTLIPWIELPNFNPAREFSQFQWWRLTSIPQENSVNSNGGAHTNVPGASMTGGRFQ